MMKLTILKAALEYYALSADCSNDDRQEVFAALASCAQVQERFSNYDIWHDECFVLTADTLSDLLNLATYDLYGKRQKTFGQHRMPFAHYAFECRKHVEGITNEQLQLGYEIISDLWHDNEANGAHNPDGTFACSI